MTSVIGKCDNTTSSKNHNLDTMRLSVFIIAFFLTIVSGLTWVRQDTSLRQVKKEFDVAHIPDDLTLHFNPKALLEVTFRQPGTLIPPIIVHAGISLSQSATSHPPTYQLLSTQVVPTQRRRKSEFQNANSQVVIRHAVGDGPFVIVIVDPDAPTPQHPDHAQFRHFLGGGFILKDFGLVLANNTPAITEFEKPSPPDGSDPHRYVFLLFQQPEEFNKQREVTPETDRANFDISSFADKVGLGNAVAGTFMWVGPDK